MIGVCIVCLINLAAALVGVTMAVKLHRQTVKLRAQTAEMRRMDKLYIRMAHELNNLATAQVLDDSAGVDMFFKRLTALHEEFMKIGTEEDRRTNQPTIRSAAPPPA